MRANVIAFMPVCTFTGTGRARAPGRRPPAHVPGDRCRPGLRRRPGGTTVLTRCSGVITTAIRPLSTCSLPAAAMLMSALHRHTRTPMSRCAGGPR